MWFSQLLLAPRSCLVPSCAVAADETPIDGPGQVNLPRPVVHELEQGISVGVLDGGGEDLLCLAILDAEWADRHACAGALH